MLIRRDRNNFGVVYLSRVGTFIRRPSEVDRFGSNPRPYADKDSPLETLPQVMEEKARRERKKSGITRFAARLAAWEVIRKHARGSPESRFG